MRRRGARIGMRVAERSPDAIEKIKCYWWDRISIFQETPISRLFA
jgi:hypothetical protein